MQMAAINRKQVPLCFHHHKVLHNGSLSLAERKLFEEGINKDKIIVLFLFIMFLNLVLDVRAARHESVPRSLGGPSCKLTLVCFFFQP